MQSKYIITVGIEQEPCPARGEDISLLAERFNEAYRFFTDTLGVEHVEAERQALSVALKSLEQEDTNARPKPSMFAACGLETARMFKERTARWCAYVRGALRAARQGVVRILRCVRPVLKLFTASSAEAASVHRTEDDAGGDEDGDDDPARTRYLQRSRVLSLLLAGEALTQPKALEYKIWRLAARIAELGKRGWRIQKRRLPGNFCEYTIDPNNPYSIDPQSTLPFEGSAE